MASSTSPKKKAKGLRSERIGKQTKTPKSPTKRKNLEKVISSIKSSDTSKSRKPSNPKQISTSNSKADKKKAKQVKLKEQDHASKFMEKFLSSSRKRPKPQSTASAKVRKTKDKEEYVETNNNVDDNLNNNNNNNNDKESTDEPTYILGTEGNQLEELEGQNDEDVFEQPEEEIGLPPESHKSPRLIYSPNTIQKKPQGPKVFQCKVCNEVFPNRYFHRKHMLREHEDQLYECRVCSFNSVHPEKLKTHIIKLHVAKKEKVDGNTEFQQELENLIEKKIPRKVIMEDGVALGRDGANKLRYVCALCTRRYSSKYALQRHVRCHTLEKPFHCDVCDFTSSYREHMKRHVTSVHLIVHSNEPKVKYVQKKKKAGDEVEEAEEDEDEEDEESKRRRNILTKRFECAVCGMKSTHKTDLMEHIKDKHPNAHIESLKNKDGSKVHLIVTVAKKPKASKKLTIQCTYCSLIFHDTWKYKVHLRSHTGVKPFRCSECFFRATSKMTVRDHIHRKHNSALNTAKIFLRTVGIDGEVEEVPLAVPWREFKCEFCGEVKTDNYNLKIHKQKEHKDALPFSCRECDARALTKASMVKHCLEKHEEHALGDLILHYEKPAKISTSKLPTCEFCNKVFAYQSQLTLHLKLHTGEKTFQCDHCEYKTNSKALVTNHLLKKHFGAQAKTKKPRKNTAPKKILVVKAPKKNCDDNQASKKIFVSNTASKKTVGNAPPKKTFADKKARKKKFVANASRKKILVDPLKIDE